MSELATICDRVWKVCPECRPKRAGAEHVWLYVQEREHYGVEFFWDRSDCDEQQWTPSGDEPNYELLIIGACVKWLTATMGECHVEEISSTEYWARAKRWVGGCVSYQQSEVAGPSQTIALLLACEELSKKESPRG